MLYTLALILFLTAMAGVIAYAGDVLGTTVGRRRLSLFGWRPKRTGQVVGIAAGIIIMLSTLIILALAFRGAANVLLNAQQAATELQALRGQLQDAQSDRDQAIAEMERAIHDASELREAQLNLQRQLEGLETQIDNLRVTEQSLQRQTQDLEGRNELLLVQNEELQQGNRSLRIANETLQEENKQLQATLQDLTEQIGMLDRQTIDLRHQLDQQAQELRFVLDQVQAVSQGDFTFRRGEIVHSGLIRANSGEAIREALGELFAEANQATSSRGAGSIVVNSDQMNSLERAVAETPRDDLVVLVARDNVLTAARVEVEVEAYENRRLVDAGQLLVSRQLHLGTREQPLGRDELRVELNRLSRDATNRLERIGLFEQVRPNPGALDLDGFMSRLARHDGPAVVGLMAKEPIYVSGPVQLELVILH